MLLKVKKSRLKGTVAIPASKSHTIRALAIAAMAHGKSTINSPLISSDTASAVDCFKALGADIDTSNDQKWTVSGTASKIRPPQQTIDVGNSGTTIRIAAGLAALAQKSEIISFTGDHQIQSRPIQPLLESLKQLGADASSNHGKPPFWIKGTLTGGKTSIAAHTSQYLTSLLIAAPLAKNDTDINVTLLNEPGYAQMTLDWLDKQNIIYKNQNFESFHIKGDQKYTPFEQTIPADFSSATFFLCAAALFADEVKITGLDFNDSQPDKAVLDYLIAMGADIKINPDAVTVKAAKLNAADIDMNATPDALPAIAVTAAFANGNTRLYNVPQARNKETDRIACIAAELKKNNIQVEELPDGIIIRGGKPIYNAKIRGYGDHRIVMAMAVAAMGIEQQSTIDTAQAVNVTFPDFVPLMASIGADIELIE